jgi:hypothetical protein
MSQYKVCSKKDRTFAIKNLLSILQHFKRCRLQSSPRYWRYTVPNVQSRKIRLRLAPAQRISRTPSYEPLVSTKLITSNVCTNRIKYLYGGNTAKLAVRPTSNKGNRYTMYRPVEDSTRQSQQQSDAKPSRNNIPVDT